jgi:tRNA A37 threonylcarbamoyladenosine biosynthesis protein TsaE
MNITHDFDSRPDSHVESVVNQFRNRSRIGIKKYNTTLDRNDLSVIEWLQHLKEELMDAVLYVEKLKSEHKNKKL